MKGKLFLFISLLLVIALPCWSEDYEAKSVTNGFAILKDRDSKKTIKAKVGDNLENGWTVVSVQDDFVVIEKWIGEEEKTRAFLPVIQVRSEEKR